MSFAEKHLRAVNSSDLTDDAQHHQAEALQASAMADSLGGIGTILHRAKYCGDGHSQKQLQGIWRELVDKKGRERNWIRVKDWPQLGHMFPAMARKVADVSLAQYLDDTCKACNGTGVNHERRICPECKGLRTSQIASSPACKMSDYEIDLARQMVGELMALEQSHAGVASAKLRRVA